MRKNDKPKNKAASFKARMNAFAKAKGIRPLMVLQNFAFEGFMRRIALSTASRKLVLKGGVLMEAILGIENRTTMDIDATLQNCPISIETLHSIIDEVSSISVDDDLEFECLRISPIRVNDVYGGYCVSMKATYDTSVAIDFAMDVSTGDRMTECPVLREFRSAFTGEPICKLLSYNLETVLAEKAEAILAWGAFSTRLKDYYDVYAIMATQSFDHALFKTAFVETAKHRGTYDRIADVAGILASIENSETIQKGWTIYQSRNVYAKRISFVQVMASIKTLLEI